MRIGNLNKRCTLTSPGTYTPDTYGGFTEGTEASTPVWCGARQLSHRETLLYGLQVGDAAYEFTFLYNTGKAITQQTSITYESRVYRVVSVNEVDETQTLIKVIANTQTN